MSDAVSLDAYFQRIGYSGPREPTLDALRGIHLQHALTIAFENLDPLLRRPVRLDLESLEKKLVRGGRGGYCFEQNLLLGAVLRTLGFRVTDLAARVIWNAPQGALRPRTHMLLRIDLEDGGAAGSGGGAARSVPYVADVGFGGLTLTAPLRLAPDIEQETPHETFRLIRIDESFVIEAWLRDAWVALYRFDLQPQLLPDYEVANWYVSTLPESHFVKGLTVARPAADRRFNLNNTQLSIHHVGGTSEQRTLSTVKELRGVLEETFGIALSDLAELDETLGRLIPPA